FPMILPQELARKTQQFLVVDVRTDSEFAAGHIAGAKHIPLDNLLKRLAEIPKNRSLAVTCGAGNRASIALSLLQREGYQDLCSLKGGMQAWMQAQLPTVED